MIIHDENGLGRVEVTDIPMPDFAKVSSATYTYSGKVLVFYRTDSDPDDGDYYNIAVVNDDGTGFQNIFKGFLRQHEKANGIRHMPFQDNKRVLLGDYVIECYPDIDSCESVKLVPVEYPPELVNDPLTMKHWSEIIIAPDNEHICWTILRTDCGAANAIGLLKRKANCYVIEKPQIISSLQSFKEDEEKEGYIIPQKTRGGEVKQFVRGGTAISLVGSKNSGITDSVVQDLKSDEVTQITKTPGYDETTIFSPDERLGIVMSTRGSETNPAIFGLMPRPYCMLAMGGMIMLLYMYAVDGVRKFRKGNIGPVLIDIERSMKEEGYQGILLNDPEGKWVYLSPMSWHPDGRKAMWPEMVRGSGSKGEKGRQIRIRKVELLDYQPQEPVPFERTPDDISYGIKPGPKFLPEPAGKIDGKISGKHSGYINYIGHGNIETQGIMGSNEVEYVNFSDDGKSFYNGFERSVYTIMGESRYEADLEMTGEQRGRMKFRAAFSSMDGGMPIRLLFEKAEDGRPKSFGYAEYNGVRLNIEDLLE